METDHHHQSEAENLDVDTQSARKAARQSVPSRVVRFPVDRLVDSPTNARQLTSPEDIERMAHSILEHGLIFPISARMIAGSDSAGILDGHTRVRGIRWLAASYPADARWRSVDALFREADDDLAQVLGLEANLVRTELTSLEKAVAIVTLQRRKGLNNKEISELIHVDEMTVGRAVRTLSDPIIAGPLLCKELEFSAATEILSAPPSARPDLVRRAIAEVWSQAEARRAVKQVKSSGTGHGAGAHGSVTLSYEPSSPVDELLALLASHDGRRLTVEMRGRLRHLRALLISADLGNEADDDS